MLSAAAVAGKLATRADASRHQGDFRKVVAGVNDTLDNVVAPINEVRRIMGAMAGATSPRPSPPATRATSTS
jgi:methyl-accepting chemotaxis protein